MTAKDNMQKRAVRRSTEAKSLPGHGRSAIVRAGPDGRKTLPGVSE
jgi:hypothetical protein